MNAQDHKKEYYEALQRSMETDANERRHEEEFIACYGNPVGHGARPKPVAFIAAAVIPAIVALAFTAAPFWIFMPSLEWWVPIFAITIWAYFFFMLDDVMRRVYRRARNGYPWLNVVWKGFFGGWISGGSGGTTFIWRS